MNKQGIDLIRAELEVECELAKEKFTEQALSQQLVSLRERLSQQAVELKTTKTTLKESEERFNQIAAMTGEWIWEQDAKGHYTYCSISVNAVLGYPWQALMGRFYDEFVPAEEREALRSKMHQDAETGQGFKHFIRRYQHRDGHLVFTESTAIPLLDSQNRLFKWRGIDRDITATRRADELVFMLSRALKQSPNAILITNLKGNIEYVNSSFTRLTGYEAEEVVGKNPRLLQSGKTSLEQYRRLWETISAGREWRDEIQDRKKSGELYWALETIAPLRDGVGNQVGS